MEEFITHILRNSRRNVKVIHIPSLKVLGNGLCDCALWPTSVVFVFLGATWATALRRNTQKEKDEKANNTAYLPACVQVLWRRGRQPDVREPACLKSTSEDMRSWRIASRGHELHSYPHKDEPCVSSGLFENRQKGAVSERYETPKGWSNQTPIDFRASSVRNDFLQHNG